MAIVLTKKDTIHLHVDFMVVGIGIEQRDIEVLPTLAPYSVKWL